MLAVTCMLQLLLWVNKPQGEFVVADPVKSQFGQTNPKNISPIVISPGGMPITAVALLGLLGLYTHPVNGRSITQ